MTRALRGRAKSSSHRRGTTAGDADLSFSPPPALSLGYRIRYAESRLQCNPFIVSGTRSCPMTVTATAMAPDRGIAPWRDEAASDVYCYSRRCNGLATISTVIRGERERTGKKERYALHCREASLLHRRNVNSRHSDGRIAQGIFQPFGKAPPRTL